jgi:hypothetical protein
LSRDGPAERIVATTRDALLGDLYLPPHMQVNEDYKAREHLTFLIREVANAERIVGSGSELVQQRCSDFKTVPAIEGQNYLVVSDARENAITKTHWDSLGCDFHIRA